jgi:hypothetical protein
MGGHLPLVTAECDRAHFLGLANVLIHLFMDTSGKKLTLQLQTHRTLSSFNKPVDTLGKRLLNNCGNW